MTMMALVVDDSMLIRYSVRRFLEQRGFTVESATNGEEALEVVGRMRPDLIITDMQMPKMSGSEFISALKSKPETAGVPVVILAARASAFDESDRQVRAAIYKDIDIEEQLASVLDEVMKRGRMGQAASK